MIFHHFFLRFPPPSPRNKTARKDRRFPTRFETPFSKSLLLPPLLLLVLLLRWLETPNDRLEDALTTYRRRRSSPTPLSFTNVSISIQRARLVRCSTVGVNRPDRLFHVSYRRCSPGSVYTRSTLVLAIPVINRPPVSIDNRFSKPVLSFKLFPGSRGVSAPIETLLSQKLLVRAAT